VVTATSEADLNPEATVLSLVLPCDKWAGGSWTDSSGKKHVLPKNFDDKKMCLYSATTKTISFAAEGDAEPFTLTFPAPAPLMIQDDRKWVQTFTLRISTDAGHAFKKGDQRAFTCILSAPDGVSVTIDQPVVVRRGPDWIPLDYGKNVEAGSALDFSGMGLQDAPAGKNGWLRNVGGHFEFEGKPGVRQRFYGVNLCFSANFPDQALADELVTRLLRLGYNAVRIHHYENWDGVIKGSKDRLTLNDEWAKRLDYLANNEDEPTVSDLIATVDCHSKYSLS
jgi:hypothetical protein